MLTWYSGTRKCRNYHAVTKNMNPLIHIYLLKGSEKNSDQKVLYL